MIANYLVWVVTFIVVITLILIVLHHAKARFIRDKKYKSILYFILSFEIILLLLILFGEPLLNKIYAYRENVLNQSEEECEREDAPFWCHL